MTKEYKDFLYSTGKMPDRYYNQLNGKSAQENYMTIKAAQREEQEETVITGNILINGKKYKV